MEHFGVWSVLLILIGWRHKYHKENAEALLDASKENGLKVNAEGTEYVFIPCHQEARKNDKKLDNKSLKI
jgi:hypothetical protein